MDILGPNGVQRLSIPTIRKNHTAVQNVRIDNASNWHIRHWRSIKTAYSSAPYFEDYAYLFESEYKGQHDYLVDLNLAIHTKVCTCLGISAESNKSEEFEPYQTGDPRQGLDQVSTSPYLQVFSDRFEFEDHLSILDLIMNLGPEASSRLH